MSSTIQLTFSAKGLPNADSFSNSDPFLVLYEQVSDLSWVRVGHSEIIHDNLNPEWTTPFTISYDLHQPKQFKVDVYDFDSGDRLDLTKSQHLATCKFWLGSLIASYGVSLDLQLTSFTNRPLPGCTLSVKGLEIIKNNNLYARGLVRGINFAKSGLISKDETILQFLKISPHGTEVVVYKSPIIFDSQSPVYPMFLLDLGALCDENFDQEFIVRVLYWKSDKVQKILGQTIVTLPQLLTTPIDPTATTIVTGNRHVNNDRIINLYKVTEQKHQDPQTTTTTTSIAQQKQLLNTSKQKGQLAFDLFEVSRYPTYSDYIQTGMAFSMSYHVDFSDNNGESCAESTSSHWVNFANKSTDRNPYVTAIQDLGAIVQHYCGGTTRIPPMYTTGFGAKVCLEEYNDIQKKFVTLGAPTHSHCFPLNLTTREPSTATSTRQVLDHYYYAVQGVKFSSPLHFSPTINFAMQIASPHLTPINSTNFHTLHQFQQSSTQSTPPQSPPLSPSAQSQPGANQSTPNQLNQFVPGPLPLPPFPSPYPRYHVAVIFTNNGDIADMKQTIQQLYMAAKMPISFLLVGVGVQDVLNGSGSHLKSQSGIWGTLYKLDGDDSRTPLAVEKNDYIDRDITQFIDYQFSSDDMLELAHNALAELPAQVVEYLHRNQFYPPGWDSSPVTATLPLPQVIILSGGTGPVATSTPE